MISTPGTGTTVLLMRSPPPARFVLFTLERRFTVLAAYASVGTGAAACGDDPVRRGDGGRARYRLRSVDGVQYAGTGIRAAGDRRGGGSFRATRCRARAAEAGRARGSGRGDALSPGRDRHGERARRLARRLHAGAGAHVRARRRGAHRDRPRT